MRWSRGLKSACTFSIYENLILRMQYEVMDSSCFVTSVLNLYSLVLHGYFQVTSAGGTFSSALSMRNITVAEYRTRSGVYINEICFLFIHGYHL